jgi:DNA polymerase III alpha subunit
MDQITEACRGQLQKRYRGVDRSWAVRRLGQELKTIHQYGQTESFVEAIAAVRMVKNEGGFCRLTGAGCGSLVAYLTDLSEVDPLRHGLLFERFLETNSPQRIKFRFVAVIPAGDDESQAFETADRGCILSGNSVTIHPANPLEAIPSLVARRISREYPGFSLDALPWNDLPTFALLQGGDIGQISQFEAKEFQETLRILKPKSLVGIAAATILNQAEAHHPGLVTKFAHAGSRAEKTHWIAEETLRETRGMILFQEQIMLLLHRLANIPLVDGYAFIKSVCKRRWEQVRTISEWFGAEATKTGLDEVEALELCERMRLAAEWVGCKSHHISEAVRIYRSAYLKAHFPREFEQTFELISG